MDKGVFVCLPTAKAAKVHNWQRFLRLKTWLENKESFGELIISVEFDFLRPFTYLVKLRVISLFFGQMEGKQD